MTAASEPGLYPPGPRAFLGQVKERGRRQEPGLPASFQNRSRLRSHKAPGGSQEDGERVGGTGLKLEARRADELHADTLGYLAFGRWTDPMEPCLAGLQ